MYSVQDNLLRQYIESTIQERSELDLNWDEQVTDVFMGELFGTSDHCSTSFPWLFGFSSCQEIQLSLFHFKFSTSAIFLFC